MKGDGLKINLKKINFKDQKYEGNSKTKHPFLHPLNYSFYEIS